MRTILKTKLPVLIILILMLVPTLFSISCSGTTPSATTSAPTAQTPAVTTTSPAAAATTPAASTAATPVSTQTVSTPTAQITLNISAAASLTDALKELNTLFITDNPNVTITPNFAGSGTLQKQIEQGAPADIFISAAAAQMDALEKENLIVSSTRKNLLNNTVVMIVPSDSTLELTDFKDVATDKVSKIAIGDPKSVPAGNYAQKAFDELGITEQVTAKYVIGADVKAVLSYVESGNVDVGFVYSTDAKLSTKVTVVATAPADINAQIVYPAAVVAASKVQDEAQKYEDFLFSDQAKAVFEKYGFTVISQ